MEPANMITGWGNSKRLVNLFVVPIRKLVDYRRRNLNLNESQTILRMMLTILLLSLCCCYCAGESHAKCPDAWIAYKGKCYGFGRTPMSFAEAVATCNAFGGNLAEIETAEENLFIAHVALANKVKSMFIGGTDIFAEGLWQWILSGNSVNAYTNWPQDEPNGGNGENCLAIYNTGEWADFSCSGEKLTFLCETMPIVAIHSKSNVLSGLPENEN